MSRAEGRASRTEIPDLFQQLEALDQDLKLKLSSAASEDSAGPFAVWFLGEALAHTIHRILLAWVIDQRWGFPRTDPELFSLYQQRALLGLDEARRLRQFLELRTLSSRFLSEIQNEGVRDLLRSRGEFLSWILRIREALQKAEER